jgi:hypothetical protein
MVSRRGGQSSQAHTQGGYLQGQYQQQQQQQQQHGFAQPSMYPASQGQQQQYPHQQQQQEEEEHLAAFYAHIPDEQRLYAGGAPPPVNQYIVDPQAVFPLRGVTPGDVRSRPPIYGMDGVSSSGSGSSMFGGGVGQAVSGAPIMGVYQQGMSVHGSPLPGLQNMGTDAPSPAPDDEEYQPRPQHFRKLALPYGLPHQAKLGANCAASGGAEARWNDESSRYGVKHPTVFLKEEAGLAGIHEIVVEAARREYEEKRMALEKEKLQWNADHMQQHQQQYQQHQQQYQQQTSVTPGSSELEGNSRPWQVKL